MHYNNDDFNKLMSLKNEIKSEKIIDLLNEVKRFYNDFNKKFDRYTTKYRDTVKSILDQFPVKVEQGIGGSTVYKINGQSTIQTEIIEQFLQQYINKFESIRYLKFLSEENRNVVFVGPNGCGKTTLLRKLKHDTAGAKIQYFTADRILLVDEDFNPKRTYDAFIRDFNDSYSNAINVDSSMQGYHLLKQFDYYINLLERERNEENENKSINRKTQRIIDEWHNLVKDRELFFEHGLRVRPINGKSYPLKYLSSGEKSILYFLIGILLQEEKDYYFIDEPENNLNPAIVSKLWNFIERERPNSIFVYLTHNSEFVATRVNAKLYWIQKFDGVEWKWSELPENNDLPQELTISLVGTREPVLFCESHDEYQYDTLIFKEMFPEFKVDSSGGCDKVIARVKAYKQTGLPHKAFGIIDCDYKTDDYLNGLEKNGIYHIPFHEIENFLLSSRILHNVINLFSTETDKEKVFDKIKEEIKSKFISNKEEWIVKNVAFELRDTFDYRGKIKQLKNLAEFKKLYSEERKTNEEIDALAAQFNQKYDSILSDDNYDIYLRYLDSKGLIKELSYILKLKDDLSYDTATLLFFKTREGERLLKLLKVEYFPEIHA